MSTYQHVISQTLGRGLVRGSFLLAILAVFAAPVLGFAPIETPPGAEDLLPQGPEMMVRSLGSGVTSLPANLQQKADQRLLRFTREHGGHWKALTWNPITLTPRLISGSGLELGTTILTAEEAEAAARRFVDSSQYLWGLTAAELEVEKTGHGLGKWSVHFRQLVGDYPVIGSRLTVTMTEAGRLYAFGGDLWPGLQATTQSYVNAAEAVSMVRVGLAVRGLASFASHEGEFIKHVVTGILPVSPQSGTLVHRMRSFVKDPVGAWMVDVDAFSGELLQIQNVLRSLDFTGTVTGEAEIYGYCDGVTTNPFELLYILVDGVGIDSTAADGSYTIPFTGTEPESIKVGLSGSYVTTFNVQGPDAQIADEITPGVPYNIFWDDSNSRVDERDVFIHTTGIHEHVKSADENWTDLDYPLPAHVNIDAFCNAFWNGESINFYHEENDCANTGRLGDVIAHEYGHGVTTFLYGATQPPTDMHEANSDVHGNTYSNNPIVGPGFYLASCEEGIRNSDNDLVWPFDLTGEGHHDGQILAGFHWDIWESLQLKLGEEAGKARALEIWHFARILGLPMIQPDQVWWTLIADDDDGNIENGTPNFDEICAAAEHHGFECPEAFDAVVIRHAPNANVAMPDGGGLTLYATIYSFVDEINPDSVMVYYRGEGDGGVFNSVVMAPAVEENEWSAWLPGYPVGSMIEYYIFGADMSHNHLYDPRNAPADYHRTRVVSVYCTFEEDNGWTVGAPDDDATQGIWEKVDPTAASMAGYPIQPGDDATADPGVLCWITGQYAGGYAWDTDADGQTTLTSPIYDFSGYNWIVVGYQRWFQTWGSQAGVMEIDISPDGGSSWTNLSHLEGADYHPHWTIEEHNVTAVLPAYDQIRVRVVMYGLPNPSIDEGGIDEFIIMAGFGDASDVEDPITAAAPLRLALASGNPMASTARIQYSLPSESDIRLRIHNVTGRAVRTLVDGLRPAGLNEVTWDGRDDSGRDIGSGIYFLQLMTPQGSRTERLVRVH
ncbi:MAG: T9SS type A sorting domain-containing protein [Candidatus Eisenbacteria bacterium]|uniref:T9SS type A sorting domain-containing protein n=1 Tax=Eiseniibacteriota bacterium TaxID=2212470 RepID=A0A948W3Y9_UNCEI|nr:T9SS type A sorting domain-containing protein [Candidatus Eisenbacteria bacterium]MBU1949450.1 T9SS type A sorting domain-containing protein [Candidatus Eisenbacteria bacterium]MBU2691627.1 T9SS type A sorting domain-containing protein [Candidatus Eisenbacteria bacterium]